MASRRIRSRDSVTKVYSESPIVKESKFLRDGMEYRKLGTSDLLVSKVCIGAMMWGEQVNEPDALRMLDLAFDDFGVNFIVRETIYRTCVRICCELIALIVSRIHRSYIPCQPTQKHLVLRIV